MNTIAKKRLADKSMQPLFLAIWLGVIQLTGKGVDPGCPYRRVILPSFFGNSPVGSDG